MADEGSGDKIRRMTRKVRARTGGKWLGRGALALLIVAALAAHSVESWGVRIDEVSLALIAFLALVFIGLDRIKELSGPGGVKLVFNSLEAAASAVRAEAHPESLGDPQSDAIDRPLAEEVIKLGFDLRENLWLIRAFIYDGKGPSDAEAVLSRLRLDGHLDAKQTVVGAEVLLISDIALQGGELPEHQLRERLGLVREALGTIKSTAFRHTSGTSAKSWAGPSRIFRRAPNSVPISMSSEARFEFASLPDRRPCRGRPCSPTPYVRWPRNRRNPFRRRL